MRFKLRFSDLLEKEKPFIGDYIVLYFTRTTSTVLTTQICPPGNNALR